MNQKDKLATVLLSAFLLSASCNMYASSSLNSFTIEESNQKASLKGIIRDASGPIIGASIQVLGTTNGVITDFDGIFN